MGKLVFGMMQSLDGYVEGGLELPPPGIALHNHFMDQVRGLAGGLYGRRMYEVMRYWDEDKPEWEPFERGFAEAWRARGLRCASSRATASARTRSGLPVSRPKASEARE